MTTRQLAFLRGVNIGGRNRLSMREVKAALEESGLADADTLLGSGNIVCSGGDDARAIIARTLEARFGLDVPVYTIAADKLRDILARARLVGHGRSRDVRQPHLHSLLRHAAGDLPPAGRALRGAGEHHDLRSGHFLDV